LAKKTLDFFNLSYLIIYVNLYRNYEIMKKILENADCVEEICPEYLEVKMEKPEGSAVEGADAKIGEFILH